LTSKGELVRTELWKGNLKKRPLGRPRLRWEDIKRLIRREWFEWINLTQDYGHVAGSF
jgi:hypothetical protein